MTLPLPQSLVDTDPLIDMTRTMAPDIEGFSGHVQDALASVAASPDLPYIIQRHRFYGSENEREIVAEWLAPRLGYVPGIDRVMITGGTQNILQILLPRLTGERDCIAIESLSYAGPTQISRMIGRSIVGVEIDEHGLIPESFAEVCTTHQVRILYCNPTIHNPTTSILPEDRRRQIVEIARRHRVTIIEDDVHAKLVPNAPPAIASIAPDLTWYMMTTSKCLGMGLRTAFLVAPSCAAIDHVRSAVPSVSAWFVPGISAGVVCALIANGGADQIAAGMRKEIFERQQIAKAGLRGFTFQTQDQGLHLWLKLPDAWRVGPLIPIMHEQGVTIRPPDIYNAANVEMPNYFRLSLVGPRTQEELRLAIDLLGKTLRTEPG